MTTTSKTPGCILSKFYIKPQLARQWLMVPCVVSYRNSTSNHNYEFTTNNYPYVVSYRNSTSNHNNMISLNIIDKLYLIEILHQTTTSCMRTSSLIRCILSKFYIKPQRCRRSNIAPSSCILSKFYIKPQQKSATEIEETCCILSKFYIKPQPWREAKTTDSSCILSKFYIKPQPRRAPCKDLARCILSKFYIKPQR